jgi:hypothetical protein
MPIDTHGGPMTISKLDDGRIWVVLTTDERNIISNCMNYMCNARNTADFHALVGGHVEEARELLDLLLSVD